MHVRRRYCGVVPDRHGAVEVGRAAWRHEQTPVDGLHHLGDLAGPDDPVPPQLLDHGLVLVAGPARPQRVLHQEQQGEERDQTADRLAHSQRSNNKWGLGQTEETLWLTSGLTSENDGV